jgi:SAM-dependent methyltransferase
VDVKTWILATASQRAPKLASRVLASSGYTRDPSKLGPPEAFGEWDASTAARQDTAWQGIVAEARSGRPRGDVEALWDALSAVPTTAELLEVGCGGGYYSELIALRYPDIAYRGVDLSPAMVATARAHYPERPFEVASAYELPFDDHSIAVVMDGVALIHMPDWRRALGQYARVASHTVVVHGVTVTETAPTTQFAKYAYGQPSLELVFARDELEAACTSVGLKLDRIVPGLGYDLEPFLGIRSTEETWVLSPR